MTTQRCSRCVVVVYFGPMKLTRSALQLSATDLGQHLACQHLIELERAAAEGREVRPRRKDPGLELLIRRGMEHEEAFVPPLQGSS